MKFWTGKEISVLAEKMISQERQIRPYGFDLTVAKIFVVRKEGDIDFGGSEQKDALVEELKPVKRAPDDKYGWWNLTAGEYIVEFNEKVKIPDKGLGVMQPLSRALKAGVLHPTLIFFGGEKVENTILMVGKSGFNVKENARISSLMGVKPFDEWGWE